MRFFAIIILLISLKYFTQQNIYIGKDASICTFPNSSIAIFGNFINDSKGGFNHNSGGDVYIYRHESNGSGNSIIINGT